ncbi:MAG: CDP-diacylglycerol--glycerol-3-phosphate 3-phosphatidyltransferase [Desulfuromonadales bacterium]|nr:MAG: CDP-diacylglycerol--glycerol-3-phosphate 3-phosphatidyltransferase [Desulfuromonadales bacterium]
MGEPTRGAQIREILTVPNVLTMLRIVLVPALILFILSGRHGAALGVFLTAGVTDALDGFIARRFNQTSRLGSFLDPLADKLLVVSSAIVLAWVGLMPRWLAMVMAGRDILILAGAGLFYLRTKQLEMDPSILSKINTFVQIALILAVLAHGAGSDFLGGILKPFFVLALVTALVSGGHYVVAWGMKAYAAR